VLSTGTLIHLQGDILVDEIHGLKDEYDNKMVKALEEAEQSLDNNTKNMAIWGENDGLVMRHGLVVMLRNRDLQRRIIGICHNGSCWAFRAAED
jgi:hypothetical protein